MTRFHTSRIAWVAVLAVAAALPVAAAAAPAAAATTYTITDLGSLGGVIVGGQFVYSGGTLQNLNNLIPAGSGYQIQSATGINANGQIVANATASGNPYQQHALLLTPH